MAMRAGGSPPITEWSHQSPTQSPWHLLVQTCKDHVRSSSWQGFGSIPPISRVRGLVWVGSALTLDLSNGFAGWRVVCDRRGTIQITDDLPPSNLVVQNFEASQGGLICTVSAWSLASPGFEPRHEEVLPPALIFQMITLAFQVFFDQQGSYQTPKAITKVSDGKLLLSQRSRFSLATPQHLPGQMDPAFIATSTWTSEWRRWQGKRCPFPNHLFN